MLSPLVNLLLEGTLETLYMVAASGIISVLGGVPLGVIFLTTRKNGILQNALCHRGFAFVADIIRAIPFIILLVVLIPVTRLIVGTSIGTTAAIVPLSIARST